MFSTWDIVRPRYWHPMASREQSMMDIDDLADLMLGRSMAFPSLLDSSALFAAPSTTTADDDFFQDLPLSGRRQAQQQQEQQTQQQQQQQQHEQQQQQPTASESTQPQRSFSTYSFSNSSIVDDKGRRVVSTRRRYEDSSGRLKALHEREIEGKKMRTVWNRMHKGDEGKHETAMLTGGTPDEFEEAWKATPFGEAHRQHQQQAIKDASASSASGSSETPATSATPASGATATEGSSMQSA